MNRWVFGYGSLIWRPGFEYLSCSVARLQGFHRSLCIYSVTHRGTEEKPGLVFGLDKGGMCSGMSFEIGADAWERTHACLREREQSQGVYREEWRCVQLQDGRQVDALVFLADPSHMQYAGRLPLDDQLRLIRQGTGHSGDNRDYVINTFRHLEELEIEDTDLRRICNALESNN